MISHIDIGYNGRLGNQLFLYSTLFKLKTLGKEVIVPARNYNWKPDGCLDQHHQRWIPYRYVLDDYFNLTIPPFEPIPQEIWTEPKQGFHPEVFELDNVSLRGYFQSWQYFEDIRTELLEELSFKKPIKDKAASIYKKYNDKHTICIHIRLGDTLAQPWMHKLSPEYIQACFAAFPEGDYNILVFSDNLEYCKNWFPEGDNVYFADGLNEAETLCLMSMCDHFLMSGSTFSWWGAYLGQKPHSVVLFPNYFDGSDRNLDEFYHPTWKRVQ
jgi:hypothetical protein